MLGRVASRYVRSYNLRPLHTTSSNIVRQNLRNLLRETAQPVAIVTFLMPGPHRGAHGTHSSSPLHFHGATLSSFTSIAMDPHPLVAFSLRIPSRMATQLQDAHRNYAHWATHMVVNLLSAAQAYTAIRFSRVDLHPHPFEEVKYTLSEEGLPILDGSLGALSCKLVAASWPLHDLESLKHGRKEMTPAWEGEGAASELFIAEVTRVESVRSLNEQDTNEQIPLIYHRRGYATTCEITPHPTSSGP